LDINTAIQLNQQKFGLKMSDSGKIFTTINNIQIYYEHSIHPSSFAPIVKFYYYDETNNKIYLKCEYYLTTNIDNMSNSSAEKELINYIVDDITMELKKRNSI
jgi:hypothetical protein